MFSLTSKVKLRRLLQDRHNTFYNIQNSFAIKKSRPNNLNKNNHKYVLKWHFLSLGLSNAMYITIYYVHINYKLLIQNITIIHNHKKELIETKNIYTSTALVSSSSLQKSDLYETFISTTCTSLTKLNNHLKN